MDHEEKEFNEKSGEIEPKSYKKDQERVKFETPTLYYTWNAQARNRHWKIFSLPYILNQYFDNSNTRQKEAFLESDDVEPGYEEEEDENTKQTNSRNILRTAGLLSIPILIWLCSWKYSHNNRLTLIQDLEPKRTEIMQLYEILNINKQHFDELNKIIEILKGK
eukprot:UN00342